MSYERILFILGIWIAILSFLGFPTSIRKFFFVISGLLVSLIAYIFYKKSLQRKSNSMKSIKEVIEGQ